MRSGYQSKLLHINTRFLENIPVLTMQLETPFSYFTRQLPICCAFDIISKPRTSSSLPSMPPFIFMLQNLLHKWKLLLTLGSCRALFNKVHRKGICCSLDWNNNLNSQYSKQKVKTQFYTEFSDTIQVLWWLCCLCMFSLIFIFPVCNSNYLAAIQSCLQHTHCLHLCSPSWFIIIPLIIIYILLKNKPSLPICTHSSTDPLVPLFNKYLSNFSNPCSHLGGTPPKALSLSAIISHL